MAERKSVKTRDMTHGAALPHLWAFALPVLLGNWLQLMYNAFPWDSWQ